MYLFIYYYFFFAFKIPQQTLSSLGKEKHAPLSLNYMTSTPHFQR